MRTMKIPKRSGGYRTVCIPSSRRKRNCRDAIPSLQRAVRALCDLSVVHGFAELRSPVTNALPHVGYQYTLSFDLADFFDSVTDKMCQRETRKLLAGDPLKQTISSGGKRFLFHKDLAMQGLPTSPILANIAAGPLDRDINAVVRLILHHTGIVYTRYADDLTFSFDESTKLDGYDSIVDYLKATVPAFAKKNGFEVNPRKTRLQSAKAGRRIITGIGVGEDAIYPTRKTKRKMRAAIHNLKHGKVKHFPCRQWTKYLRTCKHRDQRPMPKQVWLRRWLRDRVRGLEEWCQLKTPTIGRRSAERIAASLPPTDAIQEVARRAIADDRQVG